MTQLQTVNFAGADIECAQDNGGEVFVSVRRVCEGLEVDYSSQLAKLKGTHWATVQHIPTVAADGRTRDLAMIDLDTLAMWLATISPGKVSDRARPNVVLYQKECVRVLRGHFFRREGPRPRFDGDRIPKHLRERETRYPDGTVVLERFDQRNEFDGLDVDQRPESERRQLELVPDHPDADVEVLRRRFDMALRGALQDAGYFDGMNADTRAVVLTGWNGRLKGLVMKGRGREDWDVIHYERAVDYLAARHGLDLSWIFNDAEVS